MAIGDAELETFWRPLLEILALSIEHRFIEDPTYVIPVRPLSNLLAILANKQEIIAKSDVFQRVLYSIIYGT